MKKGCLLALGCLALGLASCSNENINNESTLPTINTPTVDPTVETTVPSTEATLIPSTEETKKELNYELKALLDKDIKSDNRLKDLNKLDVDSINRIVMETIDGMLDGSIYFCDNIGIKLKSGAVMKCQVDWAGFNYANGVRSVTGNKFTLEIRHNEMIYKGFYITPEKISNVDMDLMPTSYVETEFPEAAQGLIYKDNMGMDSGDEALAKMKKLVRECTPMIEEDANGYRITYQPADFSDSLVVTEGGLRYGRFSNFFLDIDSMLAEIKLCLDKIVFEEYKGDSLFPDGENPLFNDQRARLALEAKLENENK